MQTVLSSTRHNRPQTMTCLFDCLVIDCDIGLNVVCGVKKIESIIWLGLDVRRYKAKE